MENFKKASKLKLRFTTEQGVLSVEQLWDLSLPKLAKLLTGLNEILKKDSRDTDLDFLDQTKTVDTVNQLSFDILKDIYLTKKEEADRIKEAAVKRENNQKIMEIIQTKENEALSNKSIEELRAMLQN